MQKRPPRSFPYPQMTVIKGLRLYKAEKLCSATRIEALFARDNAQVSRTLAYPLRAVWMPGKRERMQVPARFLVMVPKRRIRHAVDRVTLRRRIREAYRLNRQLLVCEGEEIPEIAFIYVADRVLTSAEIHRAMRKLLSRVAAPVSES